MKTISTLIEKIKTTVAQLLHKEQTASEEELAQWQAENEACERQILEERNQYELLVKQEEEDRRREEEARYRQLEEDMRIERLSERLARDEAQADYEAIRSEHATCSICGEKLAYCACGPETQE